MRGAERRRNGGCRASGGRFAPPRGGAVRDLPVKRVGKPDPAPRGRHPRPSNTRAIGRRVVLGYCSGIARVLFAV